MKRWKIGLVAWSWVVSGAMAWGAAPTIGTPQCTNATSSGALLSVPLSSDGGAATTVYGWWGTNAVNWNVTNLGVVASGAAATNDLAGQLTAETTYLYAFLASNTDGTAWTATNRFATRIVPATPASKNSLFNPADYSTLAASLTLTGGTLRIDTKDGIYTNPTLVTVVGTVTNTYKGVVASNQSGQVAMSIFTFGSISITSSVSCVVTGNLGVVLASRSDILISATVSVSGVDGTAANGPGIGGPGAEGGVRATSWISNPPGSNHGKGGAGGNPGAAGVGWGAGIGSGGSTAQGGSYGGRGGQVSSGGVYGDDIVTNLYGGSGGGGSTHSSSSYWYGGGGGGGAIELAALGRLSVRGTIRANGGAGVASAYAGAGGASGGGIILAAAQVTFDGSPAVEAKGGYASATYAAAGSGGGGRIVFHSGNDLAGQVVSLSNWVSVAGGAVGVGQAGAKGTFRFRGDGGSGDFTLPYATFPAIANSAVSNLQQTSATLYGSLTSTGGSPATVFLYWGTNTALSFVTNLGICAQGAVSNVLSGLAPDTDYAFCFAASNALGALTAPTNGTFHTQTIGYPGIANAGCTNLTSFAASLIGNLWTTGVAPTTVYCNWGLSNNLPAWDHAAVLVGPADQGLLTNTITGLLGNSTYAYQFLASNTIGLVAASTTNYFVAPSPQPAITNGGALGITLSSATVVGVLTADAGRTTTVYCAWGTNPLAWAHVDNLGVRALGSVSNALSGLTINTRYYYRFLASNDQATAWAPTTNSFGTLPSRGAQGTINSLFNPMAYAALASSLSVTGGTIQIDTSNSGFPAPTLITVAGSLTNVYQGLVVSNQSGRVALALFCFGSINIASGVTCSVTGDAGLVLASQGNLTFLGTLALNGVDGALTGSAVSPGGPGAVGGARLSTLVANDWGSWPNNGNGGPGSSLSAASCPAVGWGAGYCTAQTSSTGGSHGGLGGRESVTNLLYGDSVLTNLYGGSGGGGVFHSDGGNLIASGGGGGGAVELVAVRTLTIGGSLTANGGAGYAQLYTASSAGSGGGIVLAGRTIVFAGSPVVQAKGGDIGGSTFGSGGSGGGGRIALYACISLAPYASNLTNWVSVAAGTNGANCVSGAAGSLRYYGDTATPELLFPFAPPAGTMLLFR
jgi:hypothetical protein